MITHEEMLSEDKLSDDLKMNLNTTYKLLSTTGVTKEELMQILDIGERKARSLLTAVSYKYPCYSIPQGKNKPHIFKLAKTKKDLEYNDYRINDRLSRVEELLYSILPNLKFAEKNNREYQIFKYVEKFLKSLDNDRYIKFKMDIDFGDKEEK